MQRLMWISLAVTLTILQFWTIFVAGPILINDHPIRLILSLMLFCGSAAGALWMLFVVICHEESLLPMILVVLCIPNSFLWYYFERLRTKRDPISTHPRKPTKSTRRSKFAHLKGEASSTKVRLHEVLLLRTLPEENL